MHQNVIIKNFLFSIISALLLFIFIFGSFKAKINTEKMRNGDTDSIIQLMVEKIF